MDISKKTLGGTKDMKQNQRQHYILITKTLIGILRGKIRQEFTLQLCEKHYQENDVKRKPWGKRPAGGSRLSFINWDKTGDIHDERVKTLRPTFA